MGAGHLRSMHRGFVLVLFRLARFEYVLGRVLLLLLLLLLVLNLLLLLHVWLTR